jgi:hypothetical protein
MLGVRDPHACKATIMIEMGSFSDASSIRVLTHSSIDAKSVDGVISTILYVKEPFDTSSRKIFTCLRSAPLA